MSLVLLGSIKGFSPNTVQEVQKNFYYTGDLLIANKFLDPMVQTTGIMGTSGVIIQVLNNQFTIVSREFTFEYGDLRSQIEIQLGGKKNTINFIQYNMFLFPDYTFNEIKNYINAVLFANDATSEEEETE